MAADTIPLWILVRARHLPHALRKNVLDHVVAGEVFSREAPLVTGRGTPY